MKIAHESPVKLFKEIQKLTDYDYCLVHLLEEDEEYLRLFENETKDREVILDNSIFELGVAFDSEKFRYWVERLKPTYYIVPDVLENLQETLLSFQDFVFKYPDLPGKKIGVLQGKDFEELEECYRVMVYLGADKIGISFDYSYYCELYPHTNKLVSWSEGRKLFIEKLRNSKHFSKKVPIHLLGCSLPQEFSHYKEMEFIESVDTSNPVVCGIYNIDYGVSGLDSKPSKKLFELINHECTKEQERVIKSNLNSFRTICNG